MTKRIPKSRLLDVVLPGGNIWDWEKQTKSYLDVDFHVKGLRLALAVADVEAEDVSRSLSFGLAALDVEDAVRRQVVHGEGRVRGDHPRAADRAPLRTEGEERVILFSVISGPRFFPPNCCYNRKMPSFFTPRLPKTSRTFQLTRNQAAAYKNLPSHACLAFFFFF